MKKDEKKLEFMTVNLHIEYKDIEDLLDSASRGSSYWSENELGYASAVKRALRHKNGTKIRDLEEGKDYVLDMKGIAHGFAVMAKKYPGHFGDFMSENADNATGDVFLQCCLFGELIYG